MPPFTGADEPVAIADDDDAPDDDSPDADDEVDDPGDDADDPGDDDSAELHALPDVPDLPEPMKIPDFSGSGDSDHLLHDPTPFDHPFDPKHHDGHHHDGGSIDDSLNHGHI